MGLPPIQVPITTLDLTAAGFDSATARSRAFQAQMQNSTYSMREAQGAARLFNEELGTHMSRHLTNVMATSQLLGPVLEMAFPIAAAVGFYEVIQRVADKLARMYYDTEGQKQFQDRVKSITEHIAKLYGETDHLNKETAGVGVSGQQKWAQELDDATKRINEQRQAVNNLSNTIYMLREGQRSEINGHTKKDIPDLQLNYELRVAELGKSIAEQAHAQAELTNAQNQGMEEYKKKIEEATKAAAAHQKQLEQLKATLKSVENSAFPGWHSRATFGEFANQAMPLSPGERPLGFSVDLDPTLAQRYLQRMKDMQGWYDETRTSAERFTIEVTKLNALFGDDRSNQVYKRALKEISDRYNESNQAAKQFGQAVGAAMEQGMLMGRSWNDVLKSLGITMAKLILQMTVLKQLQSSSSSSTAAGSFFTSLMQGFTGGHANGGYIGPGQWGIVGENGPEIARGGSSGLSISPIGGRVIQYFDQRGAVVTDDLMRKADAARMFPIIEQRAAIRGADLADERSRRR